MNERLKKRIQLIEEKLNPKPKETFDLIAYVTQIRLESERLIKLSPEEYEAEIQKPPSSKVNEIARISASHEKRFLSLTPEEQQSYLGISICPLRNSLKSKELKPK